MLIIELKDLAKELNRPLATLLTWIKVRKLAYEAGTYKVGPGTARSLRDLSEKCKRRRCKSSKHYKNDWHVRVDPTGRAHASPRVSRVVDALNVTFEEVLDRAVKRFIDELLEKIEA